MENNVRFSELGLSEKMLKAIEKKGYEFATPVQAGVIPLLLNGNKDIIGQAQTGTGKTASFAIPILERLDRNSKNIQAMILTPTRELAIQVAEEIKSFAENDIKITLLYGGQNIRDELRELRYWPHIVVWTPGRVKDHLLKKWTLNLEHINYFILDEADEMLNIGFKEDIEEIMEQTPKQKKVLLFSATMPRSIQDIVHKYIGEHDKVTIKNEEKTNSDIKQIVYKVNERDKFEALCRIIEIEFDFYGIIFCRTRSDVDDIASKLMSRGYKVEWIHGDIEQAWREKTLWRFKNKSISILVATDVAARWIDVNNLTHVVNYALPDNAEVYTHRIWRTGRAGNKWEALSFVSMRDSRMLISIERLIRQKIEIWKLPNVTQVIEFKKERLINNTREFIESKVGEKYDALSMKLLELWEPVKVLSAILREAYNEEFNETHYSIVKENIDTFRDSWSFRDSRSSRDFWGQRDSSISEWEKRLFIAKWKLDNLTPWSLIQFIEKEVWTKLWNIWSIEILREFSFMNVSSADASTILTFFKQQNTKQPLIVEAKARDWWWSWRTFSWWNSSGYKGVGSWGYKWGWSYSWGYKWRTRESRS